MAFIEWERIQYIQYIYVFEPQVNVYRGIRKRDEVKKWTYKRRNERICLCTCVVLCAYAGECVIVCVMLTVYSLCVYTEFTKFQSCMEVYWECLSSLFFYIHPHSRFVYISLSLSQCVSIELSSERVVWKRENLSISV